MHTRAGRFAVVALLLGAAAAAAFYIRDGDARTAALDGRRRTLDDVVDRIVSAINDIAAAQKAYVAYGMRDEASFMHVAEAIRQMTAAATQLRSSDNYSGEATAQLEQVWTTLSALSAAEADARERLDNGDTLAAADLLLASAHAQIISLTTDLRAFRAAELRWLEAQRRQLTGRNRLTLAIVAGLWLLGLVLLARIPRARPAPSPVMNPVRANAPALAPRRLPEGLGGLPSRLPEGLGGLPSGLPEGLDGLPSALLEGLDGLPSPPPSVDLAGVADACVAIARLTDTVRLPSTLERAAHVLDARGIIVWLAAGDTLFAAAGFGYEAAVMERLRPIDRAAENATTAAWRSGELHVVAAEESAPGAIAAPMIGPSGCVGVFAAEVRNGRETDAATRAAATILATQLAAVLAPWPGASTATDDVGGPADSTPTSNGSDRQAAAS